MGRSSWGSTARVWVFVIGRGPDCETQVDLGRASPAQVCTIHLARMWAERQECHACHRTLHPPYSAARQISSSTEFGDPPATESRLAFYAKPLSKREVLLPAVTHSRAVA